MKVEMNKLSLVEKRALRVDVFVDLFHARRLLAANEDCLIGMKPLRSILKLEFMNSNRFLNDSLSLNICLRISPIWSVDVITSAFRLFAIPFRETFFFMKVMERLATQITRGALDWHARNFRDKLAKPEIERISPSTFHRSSKHPTSYARVSVEQRRNDGNNLCWPVGRAWITLDRERFNSPFNLSSDQHEHETPSIAISDKSSYWKFWHCPIGCWWTAPAAIATFHLLLRINTQLRSKYDDWLVGKQENHLEEPGIMTNNIAPKHD